MAKQDIQALIDKAVEERLSKALGTVQKIEPVVKSKKPVINESAVSRFFDMPDDKLAFWIVKGNRFKNEFRRASRSITISRDKLIPSTRGMDEGRSDLVMLEFAGNPYGICEENGKYCVFYANIADLREHLITTQDDVDNPDFPSIKKINDNGTVTIREALARIASLGAREKREIKTDAQMKVFAREYYENLRRFISQNENADNLVGVDMSTMFTGVGDPATAGV